MAEPDPTHTHPQAPVQEEPKDEERIPQKGYERQNKVTMATDCPERRNSPNLSSSVTPVSTLMIMSTYVIFLSTINSM